MTWRNFAKPHLPIAALLFIAISIFLLRSQPKVGKLPASPPSNAQATSQSAFSSWLVDYARSSPADRAQLIQEGTAIAIARRDAMLTLMESHPEAAIAKSLSIDEWAALPAELVPYFEHPISGFGSIDLLWQTNLAQGGTLECQHRNTLDLDGKSWNVRGADFHSPKEPQSHVAVSGIALGNLAVLAPSPVRMLSTAEIAAAATRFPMADTDGIDPITGNPVSADTAALIAGKIHHFDSQATIQNVADQLAAKRRQRDQHSSSPEPTFAWLAGDEGGDTEAPVDATPFLTNNIKVLFVRVDFSDFPGEAISKTNLETTLNSVKGHVQDFSYNQATIIPTVTTGTYRMPHSGSYYALYNPVGGYDGNDAIHDDAKTLATANSYNLANYDVIAVYFPSLSGISGSKITYGGLASIGGSRHWINGVNDTNVILHEFGHNYGLYHSNYHHPAQSLTGDYQVPGSLEYGDIFDRMGKGSAPEAHFNHFCKNHLEWMPDSKVAEANADATFRIHRFDHPNALANSTLAVKVPMGGDVNWWIGYRKLYTSSSYNLSNAAYIVAEGLSQGAETNLIDCTPGSQPGAADDRKDAGLPIGSPLTQSGVTFEALGTGGTSPNEWIDVRVTFATRIGLSAPAVEIDEQAGNAWITLSREFNSSGSVSVDYATSDGSASAGSDYLASSGTITWADGDLSDKTFSIPIRPDTLAEGIENFTVTLTNAAGATLDPAATATTVSILDPGERYASFDPDFFNLSVDAIAPLANGKTLIGGAISHTSGDFSTISNFARLHPDGSVDSTFISGSGFNADVFAIAVQDNGKILIGGDFTSYNGSPCDHLVRLEVNGAIDSTFLSNIGSGADACVNAIAIQPNGKILVGGDFGTFNGSSARALVRLNSNGTPDTPLALPFNSGFAPSVYTLVAEDNGKIMVGGLFYINSTGSGFRSGVARLLADGSRDPSFDPDAGAHLQASISSLSIVNDLIALPDGKYLIGGSFTAYDENPVPYIARVHSNGTFDTTFTPPILNSDVEAMLYQPSGSIIVGGSFTSPSRSILRLEPNGNLDPTFVVGSGLLGPGSSVGPAYSLAHRSDDALMVGGNFFSYRGSTCRPIIQLASGVSPYDRWTSENFTATQIAAGDADPGADPDNDGLNNLAERALGYLPLTPDFASLYGPTGPGSHGLANQGGMSYPELSVQKADASGAWFAAQFSDDLDNWLPNPATSGPNAIYQVIEDSQGRFTARSKTPLAGRRFMRIVILPAE